MQTETTTRRAILVWGNVGLTDLGYDIATASGSTDPLASRTVVMGTADDLARLAAATPHAEWAPAGWYADDTEGGVLVDERGEITELAARPEGNGRHERSATIATTKIRITSIEPRTLAELVGYDAPDPDRYDRHWADEAARYRQARREADAALDRLTGQRVYLTERHPEGRGDRAVYDLRLTLPRTNQGVARAEGWLGTTNNVYAEALGAYEVVGHSRTHLHLRAIAERPGSFPAAPAVRAHLDWLARVYADVEDAAAAAARGEVA